MRNGDGRSRRAGSGRGRGRQEALRFPAAPSIPGADFGHPRHSGFASWPSRALISASRHPGCGFRRVQVSSGSGFGHPGCLGAGPRPHAAPGCGFWTSATFRVRIVTIREHGVRVPSIERIPGAGSVRPKHPGFALKPFANTGFGFRPLRGGKRRWMDESQTLCGQTDEIRTLYCWMDQTRTPITVWAVHKAAPALSGRYG